MAEAVQTVFSFTKLLVGDLDRTAAFYKTVFGFQEWQRVDAEIEGRAISEIILQPLSEGQPTLVLLSFLDSAAPRDGEVILGFMVKQIEALFERIPAAGGRITEPVRVMAEMGIKVGFVRDVEGHLLEIVEQI